MKFKILPILSLFLYQSLSAQVAGPNNPTSFSNALLSGYSQTWIDIANAQMEDENYATFGNLPGTAGSHTDYLMVKDFGFQIPGGTIIDGIKVEVLCSDTNSRTSDYSVRIIKTGAISGDEKATGTPYPFIEKYLTYGGSTDLWGETWNYKFIDDNQFGVAIAAQRNTSDNIITAGRVNTIRITVYYTFITLPVSLTGFTATLQSKTVQLKWNTNSENNIINYNLERSADGRNFNTLTSMQAQNLPVCNYNNTDNNPLPGVSYYRLNIQGMADYQKYSQIISVKYNRENSVSIYPSVWQKGEDLNITNNTNEKLTIYFFNAGGQVLSTAITDKKLVPTVTLASRKGLIYYKITDTYKNTLGTGQLLIQ